MPNWVKSNSDRSMPSETINLVKLSSIAPKHDKSQFSNTLPNLLNIATRPSISKSDRLRLANMADMSKFSVSKLLIKPDRSSLSKSILDTFVMALMVVMTNSELLKTSMSSDKLMLDKS